MQIFPALHAVPGLTAGVIILGIVFILIEMFQPGFGFFGIAGTILLFFSILLTAKSFVQVILMTAILIVIITLLLTILLRSATKGRMSQKLILRSAIEESAVQNKSDLNWLIGKRGITKTTLRPIGIADFDGVRLDVRTYGEYLDPDIQVQITAVENTCIYVKKITDFSENN